MFFRLDILSFSVLKFLFFSEIKLLFFIDLDFFLRLFDFAILFFSNLDIPHFSDLDSLFILAEDLVLLIYNPRRHGAPDIYPDNWVHILTAYDTHGLRWVLLFNPGHHMDLNQFFHKIMSNCY